MKKSKLTNKVLILLSVIALLCVFGFTTLIGGVKQSFAFTSTDEGRYVKVDEIWDDGSRGFNETNLMSLLKYVSGKDGFSMQSFPELYSQAQKTRTATDIRNSAVSGKTNQQDVVVTYGGKDWTVTYLSLNKEGDVVLTLWLADYEQEANPDNSGLVTWLGKTRYTSYARLSSAADEHPHALYGTSYVRTVVLNNGGTYLHDKEIFNLVGPEVQTESATTQQEATFAKFTYDEGDGFLDYIETPRNMAWQENGEYAQDILSFEYNLSNEMWSSEITDDGFAFEYIPEYGDEEGIPIYGGPTDDIMNMATKEYNGAWADDKLWLPSMSEIGYCRGQTGLWKTTMEQRTATQSYFTRTMKNNSSNHVYVINNDGTCYNPTQTIDYAGVRPALHLNISKALSVNAGDIVSISVEGTLKAGDLFDENALTVYGVYATGYVDILTENVTFTGYTPETPLTAGQTIEITYNDDKTCEYTVLQTTLTNDDVSLKSQIGFDNDYALEVTKLTEQDAITEIVGESIYEQLGGVETLYKVAAKKEEVTLDDSSAVITISVKVLKGDYKFYTFADGKVTQIWTDPSKNLNVEGTEVTLLTVKVEPIQEPTPDEGDVGGDEQPNTPTANAPKDKLGIILGFVFAMLTIICLAVVFVLLFSKKNNKKDDAPKSEQQDKQ